MLVYQRVWAIVRIMHNFHQLPRLVKSLHVTLVPDGEAPPLELEILEKEAETGGSTRDGKWVKG